MGSNLCKTSAIKLTNENIADDIVALCKPYGLEMFGDKCQHSVEKYLPPLCDFLGCQSLYQVHRLDKTTSGILLLAKTKERHSFLVEKFRRRQIQKTYWAIVNGTPQPGEGVIKIPLGEAKVNGRFKITVVPEGSKRLPSSLMPALTEYKTLKHRENRSLLEVKPVTGFKHQIRAHLGLGLGTAVLGDHKFSSVQFDGRPQKIHGDILLRLGVRRSRSRDLPIFLHAKRLLIPQDEDKHIVIECKLPFHFNNVMKALKLAP